MKTIRILHTRATTTEQALEQWDGDLNGYEFTVTSLGNAASPVHYLRYPNIILIDWLDTDAKAFAGQFFLSTIVLEVEDEDADVIQAELESRSVNAASTVV